jgi:hypothetical protein
MGPRPFVFAVRRASADDQSVEEQLSVLSRQPSANSRAGGAPAAPAETGANAGLVFAFAY